MNSGNSKIFGSNFGLFWPKFCPPIFFSWFLPLLDVIHCYKLSLYATKRKNNKTNLS